MIFGMIQYFNHPSRILLIRMLKYYWTALISELQLSSIKFWHIQTAVECYCQITLSTVQHSNILHFQCLDFFTHTTTFVLFPEEKFDILGNRLIQELDEKLDITLTSES